MVKNNISFAVDANFVDSVYLGAEEDFRQAGFNLQYLQGQELPIMVPQPAQNSFAAPIPQMGTPNSRQAAPMSSVPPMATPNHNSVSSNASPFGGFAHQPAPAMAPASD